MTHHAKSSKNFPVPQKNIYTFDHFTWVNSTQKSSVDFSSLNYVDSDGEIAGNVIVDHKTKQIRFYVGNASGPARSVRHAQRVVEWTVAK